MPSLRSQLVSAFFKLRRKFTPAKMEELDILPGVGPKMAQAIIDFREAHGKFSTLEDLQKVKGFGPKKFAAIRPHITLAD